jgi:hypothetical protein
MSRADAAHGERERREPGKDLSGLISAHEDIEWRDVPHVTPAEAAVWTQRLIQARADLEADIDG